MTYRILILFLFLGAGWGCGVKGAPMPRKDEAFIRPSVRENPKTVEQAEKENLIRKKEKR